MHIDFETMGDEIQAAVESGGTSEIEVIAAGCLLVGNGMAVQDAARVISDRGTRGDLALYVVELFGMTPWVDQLRGVMTMECADGR